jgi:hypothetical protein
MVELGDVLSSLISGLIKARASADQQTAIIAETYKANPLLEGLSVPRIRIPELIIDMPFVIEGHSPEKSGVLDDPKKIVSAIQPDLVSLLSQSKMNISSEPVKTFSSSLSSKLEKLKQSGGQISKESIIRCVQETIDANLIKTKIPITDSERENILKEIPSKVAAISLVEQPVGPDVQTNIRTADVKNLADNTNVVRLKITMKEEGLEWAVRKDESGNVQRTLQPE